MNETQTKKQRNHFFKLTKTATDMAIIIMALAILILLLFLGGCTSTKPAENRCLDVGLQVDKMSISENPNKTQEVIVECSKYPSKLKGKK